MQFGNRKLALECEPEAETESEALWMRNDKVGRLRNGWVVGRIPWIVRSNREYFQHSPIAPKSFAPGFHKPAFDRQ